MQHNDSGLLSLKIGKTIDLTHPIMLQYLFYPFSPKISEFLVQISYKTPPTHLLYLHKPCPPDSQRSLNFFIKNSVWLYYNSKHLKIHQKMQSHQSNEVFSFSASGRTSLEMTITLYPSLILLKVWLKNVAHQQHLVGSWLLQRIDKRQCFANNREATTA